MNNYENRYFGYGTMTSETMSTLLGRCIVGKPAHIVGFVLAVQGLPEIPNCPINHNGVVINPRVLLEKVWGADFRSYGIVAAENSIVYGHLYTITPAERQLIREYELIFWGWFEEQTVWARTPDLVQCLTESFGKGQTFKLCTEKYSAQNEPPYLMPVEEILINAYRVGKEFRSRAV